MHEGEGFGAVAVDADGVGLQGYGAAVVGLYGTLRRHLQDPRNGGILVFDHCTGSAALHKAAVSLVAAVCKTKGAQHGDVLHAFVRNGKGPLYFYKYATPLSRSCSVRLLL